MVKLRIWGGLKFVDHQQVRHVVVARSKREASDLLDVPYRYFNGYWSETGNEDEVALLTQGTVGVWRLVSESHKRPHLYEKVS